MIFVGDDWAEAHHDIYICDESGGRIASRRLSEGIDDSFGRFRDGTVDLRGGASLEDVSAWRDDEREGRCGGGVSDEEQATDGCV